MNPPIQATVSTKQYIIWAFLELLGLQSFENISVKEIVQKAGISRSTFYLHFHDKYQLIDFVSEDLTSKFLSFYDVDVLEGKPSSTIKTTTLSICEHVFAYRHFYYYELDRPMHIQQLTQALAMKLQQVYPDPGYAIFASYGTIGYLTFWVKGGFTLNPQEAAEHLIKIGTTNWTQYHIASSAY